MGEQGAQDRRRSSLLLVAAARLDDGSMTKVIVRDLSPSGLKGEIPDPPVPDQRLTLNLGRAGWVGATVVWTSGKQFGARFAREIDPAKARRPVSAQAVPDRRSPAERRKPI